MKILALALLLACGTAHAEEAGHGAAAEHHGIDAKTLALQLLNFGALLFILIRFAGPAVNKALKARHEQLKTDLDEANRLRLAAEARFKVQEQRLANLELEIATMRDNIRKEAESEKARLIAAAEERARRIQQDTRFQLEQQVKEAEIRFKQEVAAAAVKIAENLLRKSVGSEDEQRLTQGFIKEMSS